MKTSMIIICTVLATLGLSAFGYMKWGDATPDQKREVGCKPVAVEFDFLNFGNGQADVEFVYEVESRFMTRITKENLLRAESIADILPAHATESVASYSNVEVCILLDDQNIREKGNDETSQPWLHCC